MSNFKNAKIGDTIFVLDELTFKISHIKVIGVVLADSFRKLYRIYYGFKSDKQTILEPNNSYIIVNETDNSYNSRHFSLDLSIITAKRKLIKEQKQAQLLKEIRSRIKLLKKIDSNIESCKQRVMGTFGEK